MAKLVSSLHAVGQSGAPKAPVLGGESESRLSAVRGLGRVKDVLVPGRPPRLLLVVVAGCWSGKTRGHASPLGRLNGKRTVAEWCKPSWQTSDRCSESQVNVFSDSAFVGPGFADGNVGFTGAVRRHRGGRRTAPSRARDTRCACYTFDHADRRVPTRIMGRSSRLRTSATIAAAGRRRGPILHRDRHLPPDT